MKPLTVNFRLCSCEQNCAILMEHVCSVVWGILLLWPAAILPYYYPLRRKQCRFMFFVISLFWLFFPVWLFLVQNCSKLCQGQEKLS